MTSLPPAGPAAFSIRPDCRYYSGYKPCGRSEACPDCPNHEPRGAEILIIKLGAMGDVLRTKCLLPALKRAHPTSWITWITAPGSEAIVRDPLVDEVRAFDTAGVLALEGRVFDVMVCLDKEAAALALGRRVEARAKYGYAPTPFNTLTVWNRGAEYALRMGLSDEFKYRTNRRSHLDILHEMAELEYHHDGFSLMISDDARARAARVIEPLHVPRDRPVVGLNTGCGAAFETKQWTIDGMVELIEGLVARGEFAVALLGGPREAAIHAELRRACTPHLGRSLFDLGTQHDLETFFALVDRADVVVSADSLAMHVATALKKPTVAFFGPTAEQEIDLMGRGEKIVTDYACSPCYLKRCDVRPSCMQAMSGATVEAAVRRVWAAHQPATQQPIIQTGR